MGVEPANPNAFHCARTSSKSRYYKGLPCNRPSSSAHILRSRGQSVPADGYIRNLRVASRPPPQAPELQWSSRWLVHWSGCKSTRPERGLRKRPMSGSTTRKPEKNSLNKLTVDPELHQIPFDIIMCLPNRVRINCNKTVIIIIEVLINLETLCHKTLSTNSFVHRYCSCFSRWTEKEEDFCLFTDRRKVFLEILPSIRISQAMQNPDPDDPWLGSAILWWCTFTWRVAAFPPSWVPSQWWVLQSYHSLALELRDTLAYVSTKWLAYRSSFSAYLFISDSIAQRYLDHSFSRCVTLNLLMRPTCTMFRIHVFLFFRCRLHTKGLQTHCSKTSY